MKRVVISLFAVAVVGLTVACASNPGVPPTIAVTMPETFSLNPDKIDEPQLAATINITHKAPIKEWTVQVNTRRAGQGTGTNQAQNQAMAAVQNLETGNTQAAAQNARERRPFFEHTYKGKPGQWKWDGKTSREGRNDLVQSATDYSFVLTVVDKYDNKSTYEGVISVDVLVRKEANDYRIIVPAIAFPPNGSDLSKVTNEDDVRSNRRVLRLIGNALKKFDGYAVTVEGHSNPTTPPNTPQRTAEETGTAKDIGLVPLSKDRAQAVADYLVANHNVDASRLTVVGIGGERTIAAWDDADENWKNRRVEFILTK